MRKIHLTKYAQSRFGNLGDDPIESMIRDAGSKELDAVDRGAVGCMARETAKCGPRMNGRDDHGVGT